MVRVRLVGGTLAVILCMWLLPASASAQATTASGIAGSRERHVGRGAARRDR